MRNGNQRSFSIGLMIAALATTLAHFGLPSHAAEPGELLPSQGQHRLFNASMPPGAIGAARLQGRGPVAGYFQPVAFSGPGKTEFGFAQGHTFAESSAELMAGLLVGRVYRFRITNIPDAEGAELYPTIEIIDRTYPPPGLATLYPIRVNLDQEDLDAAMRGELVTRVVFLEDPSTAMPLPETPKTSRAIDIAEYQDPLEVADRFGRPVAIIRIGSVAPPNAVSLMPQFFFGFPVWAPIFQPEPQQ